MAGLAELAAVMMDVAQRRMDVTAANIGNINTPGYRARRAFQHVVADRQGAPAVSVDFARASAPAVLKATGNPLDIAVGGAGALLLRDGDRYLTTGGAQLRRNGEGRLVDSAGRALQAAGGGDVFVSDSSFTVLRDGAVLVNGQPEARIGLFDAAWADGAGSSLARGMSGEAPLEAASGAMVLQGVVVASNVELTTEMVELTQAGRMAEAGARIFQIGDELLGKASTAFGDIRR